MIEDNNIHVEASVEVKLRYFYIATIGQNSDKGIAVNSFNLKSEFYPTYEKCVELTLGFHPGQTQVQVIGITEMSKEDFITFISAKHDKIKLELEKLTYAESEKESLENLGNSKNE